MVTNHTLVIANYLILWEFEPSGDSDPGAQEQSGRTPQRGHLTRAAVSCSAVFSDLFAFTAHPRPNHTSLLSLWETARGRETGWSWLQPPSTYRMHPLKGNSLIFTGTPRKMLTAQLHYHPASCTFSNSSIPTLSTSWRSSGRSGGFTWCSSTATTQCFTSWTDTSEGEWPPLTTEMDKAKLTRIHEGK